MTDPLQETKKNIEGLVAIALTSFTKDLNFDKSAYKRHLHSISDEIGLTQDEGAVIVNGSTGECYSMSKEERKAVAEVAVEEIGDKVPVIVGCNHSNVNQSIELAQHAEDIGATGVMMLPPYYFTPPTKEEVLSFYQKVSKKIDLGILYYNNPEISKYDIPIEVLSELIHTTNVVAIKECTPHISKMEKVVREVGNQINVLNGQGEFLEPYAELAGTDGFISSTANVAPKMVLNLWENRSEGKLEKAMEIKNKLLPYLNFIADEGEKGQPRALSLIKEFTNLRGSSVGPGRLPLQPVDKEDKKQINKILEKMDLL